MTAAVRETVGSGSRISGAGLGQRAGPSRAVVEQQSSANPAIALFGDEVCALPDEAYVKFTRELAAALRSMGSETQLISIEGGGQSRGIAAWRQGWKAVGEAAATARHLRAPVIVYSARSSVTVPALIHARLLRHNLGDRPLIMIALQNPELRWHRRLCVRLLAPDVLLVSTVADRDRLRSCGPRVEMISGGVDLCRFRPARDGAERAELRERWGLPQEQRLVLHVGHAKLGRNLSALLPIAAVPGITVVLVLSHLREAAAAPVVAQLRARGVIVREEYLERIEELYRACDCYVLPTASTKSVIAFPLSVAEALASGLPVVARRLGALPERFSDEPDVQLVDSDQELAGAVAKIEMHPSNHHVDERLGWAPQAEALLSLARELASPSH